MTRGGVRGALFVSRPASGRGARSREKERKTEGKRGPSGAEIETGDKN